MKEIRFTDPIVSAWYELIVCTLDNGELVARFNDRIRRYKMGPNENERKVILPMLRFLERYLNSK